VQVNCRREEEEGEIEVLARHLRPEGLFLVTAAPDEDEARRTVDRVAKAFMR